MRNWKTEYLVKTVDTGVITGRKVTRTYGRCETPEGAEMLAAEARERGKSWEVRIETETRPTY